MSKFKSGLVLVTHYYVISNNVLLWNYSMWTLSFTCLILFCYLIDLMLQISTTKATGSIALKKDCKLMVILFTHSFCRKNFSETCLENGKSCWGQISISDAGLKKKLIIFLSCGTFRCLWNAKVDCESPRGEYPTDIRKPTTVIAQGSCAHQS